jgi:hypothetical protein
MIPARDETSLARDIDRAGDLAEMGLVRVGYRTLDEALARAESLSSTAWGWELVDRYRRAMAHYAEAYGIRFPIPLEWSP